MSLTVTWKLKTTPLTLMNVPLPSRAVSILPFSKFSFVHKFTHSVVFLNDVFTCKSKLVVPKAATIKRKTHHHEVQFAELREKFRILKSPVGKKGLI